MRGDRVWKRRSDRFAISVTQDTLRNLGKSGFQCPHQSLAKRSFAPRALSTGGGEPGRKTARVSTLLER